MISRFVLTALLATALAAMASAQRGGGGGRTSGIGDNMQTGGAQARPTRLDMLERYLSLNKDQRKDVKNIMDGGQKEAAPLRDQMVKARADVAAAVESGKSDAVDQAVKGYADLETKMAAIELKSFVQVYNLLDADQKAKTQAVFAMMGGVFNGKNWMEVQP